MIENGQIWVSGGRDVCVVGRDDDRVLVRDSYGWRRSLTEDELSRGFSTAGEHVDQVRGVMARRSLADLEPA